MRTENDIRANESASLATLAMIVGLLPVIAVNGAYALAALFGTVPLCFPYFDGCTSISSTGRTSPSVWVFKPAMLAAALAMAVFFVRSARLTSDKANSGYDGLALSGLAGAAALVLYLTFLGTEGPVYQLLRRYGVSLYFGFTYLAQLLLARRLLHKPSALSPFHARYMLGLSALLLLIGIASIPISNFVVDKDRVENIVEWNFALLLQLNFLFAARALRARCPLPDERLSSSDKG